MNIGQKIIDGTCAWVLRHKGEMHNVGDIWMTKAAFNANGFMIHAITGLAMLDCHICDGTNGTANMLNRFAMGTNKAGAGATGGANNLALTAAQMPVHAHGASAWTDAQGNHCHKAAVGITYSNNGNYGAETQYQNDLDLIIANQDTTWAGSHTHNVGVSVANAGGNAAFDNRPAFVAVAFVQKIY